MGLYLSVLKKYAVFSGRASRKEYWMFFLFAFLGGFVTGFIDAVIGTFDEISGIGVLSGLFILGIIIPSIVIYKTNTFSCDQFFCILKNISFL